MQARETLEKQLGREPTMDEIAGEAGLSRREVTAALESVVEPVSLEEPVYTDGGDAMYLIDQVRDPDGEDSWISGLQFRQTVAGLTPREKRIMELRYLRGKTQMEVAQEIGISQAQVSRLEKRRLEPIPGRALNTAAPLFRPSGGVQGRCASIYGIFGGWQPRRADVARLCCVPNTARTCADSPGLTRTSRTETSLCTVDLLQPKRCSRSAHGGPALHDVFCQLYRPLFRICSHTPTAPCIVLLQPMRRAGQLMSARVDFCRPAALYWTRT